MNTVADLSVAQSSDLSVADVPEWLREPQEPTPADRRPASMSATRQAALVYPQLFEQVLERVCSGEPIAHVIQSDVRGVQLGRFMYWVGADPVRRRRYEEACTVAAEVMAHQLVAIADAVEVDQDGNASLVMEDAARSALRIRTRTTLMEKWSPGRYGDSKHIRIDQTSLRAEVSPDDLRRMSLADLKRMAYERVVSAAPSSPFDIDAPPPSDTSA